MTTDLITQLNLASTCESSQFLLLTNSNQYSQNFCVETLFNFWTKKGLKVLLVSLSQNFTHYSCVAAKCGINIKTLREKDCIRLFDVLSEETNFDFDIFEKNLKDEIASFNASLILIDDISLFLSLNVDFKRIYQFVYKLNNLIATKESVILAIGSSFPSLDEDEETRNLVASCIYLSDIWCQLLPPQTGFSTQISGIIKIHYNLETTKEFHYKLGDRNVSLKPFSVA